MYPIVMFALIGCAAADPLLFTSQLLAAPAIIAPATTPTFSSAALLAPGTPTAFSAALVAPAAPSVVNGQIAPVAPVAPVSSVSAYSYGSSYSVQDYLPVVNQAAPLSYSLPYAYAGDWFYRRR